MLYLQYYDTKKEDIMQKIYQNNDSFRLRKAAGSDLAELKAMYGRIIEKMNADGIAIWDDFYPCELFENDIRDQQLYVLTDGGTIVSAFTLLDDISGSSSVEWQLSSERPIYLDRFGVNTEYRRCGIASLALEKAQETALSLGADCLRLFVVDINSPAISLYEKNGFIRAKGIFTDIIDDELVLHEYGYEIRPSENYCAAFR